MTEYNPLLVCPINCKSMQLFGIFPMSVTALVDELILVAVKFKKKNEREKFEFK
jgi:hypothetical protein